MITINFHKSIRKYTNNQKSFTSDAVTYLDLIQNCIGIFPDLLDIFKSFIKYTDRGEDFVLISNNKIIEYDFLGFKAKGTIYLCPVIYGAGGKGLFGIFAFVAVVALIIASGGTAAPIAGASFQGVGVAAAAEGVGLGAIGAGATGSGIVSATGLSIIQRLGINIALSLLQNLLASPGTVGASSNAPDAGIRRNNDVFDGLVNTTNPLIPVFLNYGLVRIPGQLVSGYIKTVGHGKTDIIEVGNYF